MSVGVRFLKHSSDLIIRQSSLAKPNCFLRPSVSALFRNYSRTPKVCKSSGFLKTVAFFSTSNLATAEILAAKMHSTKTTVDSHNVKIMVLPATADNFMYLIIDKQSSNAFAVDPVEPETVMDAVRKENVNLVGILTTHHHWDHAGGNEKLVSLYKAENANSDFEVYGGDDRIGGLTKKVGQGEIINLGSTTIECLFTPCHTTGHICYYIKSDDITKQKPSVFTGDTLFIAGCGRFFEGTPPQMHSALVEKLGNLPPETQVFCGHEYTVNNLKFALKVEPNNQKIKDKLSWSEDQRSKKSPTVPSTIAEEKETNPFMRVVIPEVQKAVGAKDAIDCMGIVRSMKDNFKA